MGRLLSRILSRISSTVLSAAAAAETTAARLASSAVSAPGTTWEQTAGILSAGESSAAPNTVARTSTGKTGTPFHIASETRRTDDFAIDSDARDRSASGPSYTNDKTRSGSAKPAAEHARTTRISIDGCETCAKTKCIFGHGGRETGKRAWQSKYERSGSETKRRNAAAVERSGVKERK